LRPGRHGDRVAKPSTTEWSANLEKQHVDEVIRITGRSQYMAVVRPSDASELEAFFLPMRLEKLAEIGQKK
jgi:hypothetical protein